MADPGKEKSQSAGAAWSAPLERLDEIWQTLEARLCAGVLIAEVMSLTLWVVLRDDRGGVSWTAYTVQVL